MKPILIGLAVVGGLIVLPIGCGLYSTYTTVATAPSRVVNKTLGTDNIIQNYEWFKRQVQDVGAMDQRLASQKTMLAKFEESAGPRSAWTFEDKTEHSRLTAIVAGLEGQRASMVAEYNARTQMMNRDLFRSKDLPETLN